MALANTVANYLDLKKKIAKKEFAPVYLLHGEESFFIEQVSELLEAEVLPEAEKSFNQTIVYGKDLKTPDLLAMARRYPMMSKYQLIIVKEAQNVKDWAPLLSYLEKPMETTILVICHKDKKFDMRIKTGKAFQKHTVYLADKLYENQIRQWIPEFLRMRNRSIAPDAVNLLVEFLGADLPVIHNELEKVMITVKEDLISSAHIADNVGFNREYNIYELQKAVGARDFNRSIQIAHQMSRGNDKGDYIRDLGLLNSYFTKILKIHGIGSNDKRTVAQALGMNEFFVGEMLDASRNFRPADLEKIFEHLKYLDLRLKGVHRGNSEDGEMFLETIIHILKN